MNSKIRVFSFRKNFHSTLMAQLNTSASMSQFSERQSTTAEADRNLGLGAIRTRRSLEFPKPVNGFEIVQVALTCLVSSNDPETEEMQACAYYLAAFSALFPGLEPVMKNLIQMIGYNTIDVTTSNPDQMFELLDWVDTPTIAVMIGQATLLLYKHISDLGYQQFMLSRISALKAKAGYRSTLAESSDIVFSLERAKMIRARLGANQRLRASILQTMLVNQETPGPFGGVCNYICQITAWTEMAYMVFIFDILCITKSPVLRDPRVQGEVRALYKAYLEINKATSPQYYKIMFPEKASSVLTKSKFPILIAVAASCRASRYDSVTRYVTPVASTNALVTELVSAHNAYIRNMNLVETNMMIRYLTSDDQNEAPAAMVTEAAGQN